MSFVMRTLLSLSAKIWRDLPTPHRLMLAMAVLGHGADRTKRREVCSERKMDVIFRIQLWKPVVLLVVTNKN